ncbi:MAG TPA: hypothetical protein VJ875_01060 [Pyrinomonadaceae bacterium]|nr:hypothetical protein [Pyrinomonadaceae bacterium]
MSHQRRRLVSFLLATLGCSVAFAVILWVLWAHDLHLNVYSYNTYWYREEFPTYFKVIVTAVLSLILGLITAAVIWLTRYLMRRDDSRV